MHESDRICSPLFDEVSLSTQSGVVYSEKFDQIIGYEDNGSFGRTKEYANHALVFMVRGMRKKFKQPVTFYFCKDVTKTNRLEDIIVQVIESLQGAGLHVACTICDQGTTNKTGPKTRRIYKPYMKELPFVKLRCYCASLLRDLRSMPIGET